MSQQLQLISETPHSKAWCYWCCIVYRVGQIKWHHFTLLLVTN